MANLSTQNNSLRLFTSLKIRIGDILGETIGFLQETFKQSKTIFTAASPFGQLLIVFENLSQLIFYYIEDSITELNIYEASRASSIYSLASLAGHNPSRAIGATAQIRIKPKTGVTFENNIIILNDLLKIKCTNNGLQYVLELPQDELRLDLTDSQALTVLGIRQGEVQSQTFTAKGIAFESYQMGLQNNYYVDNFKVNVYVNGEMWTKYESLLDIPRGDKGFIIKTGITNGLDLYFGNGSFGKIPTLGSTIVVEYLSSEGAGGNIKVDDVRQINFTFDETGFSIVGDEIDLNSVLEITTISPPSFGVDPEELELTRLIAPKTSKNFALINVDNYEVLLQKLQMFSTIRVFLAPPPAPTANTIPATIAATGLVVTGPITGVALPSTGTNSATVAAPTITAALGGSSLARMINLFLIPDVSQLFTNGSDYFKLNTDKFKLTNYQKNQLLNFIERSGTKMISTDIIIIDPIITKYVLNISVIGFEDVSNDIIKSDVTNAIGQYFIKLSRYDRVPKSDLIKIIEEINGVDSVSITILSELNEKAAIDRATLVLTGADSTTSQIQSEVLIGLDEFNDIIINSNEFPVIRGGWTDRAQNTYSEVISTTELSPINIEIKTVKSKRNKIKLL
jgi:hypothetical protein